MKWFATDVDVRYADTDQMGIVHHAVHPIYCEIGRTDLCARIGLPYHELEKDGIFLMVAAMEMRYKAPARYGQPLQVRTAISALSRRFLAFDYRIHDRASDALLLSGTTKHLFTRGVGAPIALEQKYLDILQRGQADPSLD